MSDSPQARVGGRWPDSRSVFGGASTWSIGRPSTTRSSGLRGFFARIARGEADASPPATICVLSGDVHHTYISEATWPEPFATRVYQITCSPLHNGIPLPMRLVFKVAWSRYAQRVTHLISRFGRVPPASIDWQTTAGPYFGNHLAMLRIEGRTVLFGLEKSAYDDDVTRATPEPEASRDLTRLDPALDNRP